MITDFTASQQELWDVFQRHVGAEIEENLEETMATMASEPHNIIVANLVGGFGYDGVRQFYKDRLIGQFFPADCAVTDLTRTIADNTIVVEQVLEFTHSQRMDWMLPGVEPTGRPVRIALVVIVGVDHGKVAYEHVYWDQASVLVQIGLLDPTGLPVADGRAVDLLFDPSRDMYRVD